MTSVGVLSSGTHPDYSHGVLVHDTDDELVEETRAFVGQGLASGGQVLVHGTRERIALMQRVLGSHRRLEYGFDEELYLEPTRTLFAYQQRLAERAEDTEYWVTGTVPLGGDSKTQTAWNRYESAVDEALAAYPFHALCTYDTRTRPASVIAAARATHALVSVDQTNRASPEYVEPAAFLGDPLAQVPTPPSSPPSAVTTVIDLEELAWAHHLLMVGARHAGAVPAQRIEDFLMAVHEVAANGLVHGAPPVQVTLWAEAARLTCLVEDSGAGNLHPMTGFRHPGEWGPMGLWAARQEVDDLVIGTSPAGGCSILLTVS